MYMIKILGPGSVIKDLIKTLNVKTLMLDRAEQLIHEHFGGVDYWTARRSAVFSKQLVAVANEIRKDFLDSDDERDDTVRPEKWEDYQVVILHFYFK